jgi:hypothetical protein
MAGVIWYGDSGRPGVCPLCGQLAPCLLYMWFVEPDGRWECPKCAYPTTRIANVRYETMPFKYAEWYGIADAEHVELAEEVADAGNQILGPQMGR